MTMIVPTAVVALGLALLAAPVAAQTQPVSKVHRIGFLGNSTPALEAHLVGPFRDGLRELGYVDGQNIVIEYRWAEGNYERFPALIAELLARKVEVIVTAGTPASLAVKKATTSVPIVVVGVGDPVASGLVASLTRPGGNVTGLTSIAEEMEAKRLELLREVIPGILHIAVLNNSRNVSLKPALDELQAAASGFQMKVLVLEVHAADQLDGAFSRIARERPAALIVLGDRLFLHSRVKIVEFAAQQRLPVVAVHPEHVAAGGLMAFGASYAGMHRRAAYYVDRILKGAKPADLPVERPKTFELVINLKTARALGLTIPQSVMLRADHVIQ